MHKAKKCVETNVQGGVRRPASMCVRISEPQIVILLTILVGRRLTRLWYPLVTTQNM
jgi:hypothetical protein